MHQCLNFVSYLDDFRYCGKQKKKMQYETYTSQETTKDKKKAKNQKCS